MGSRILPVHSRVSGNADVYSVWVPAFAGTNGKECG
jgi:hypothetical protein